ncbi:V-type ATP synthase subunit I [Clostridium tarantellae]|uniref:V-type ATP synthase subunit I n=1 Tax=Clostridium tarantellae TaxID=39493 RepID=A0A6I1MKV5_9CLOT|nr:V-type ATP synthase subunit I [Clostridium tarantellae]MPQ42832.1 V-type ATP synthase subunit I [Clostridium tarantellae]
MAIVKMNKFTLLTFESQKEELLRKLQAFSQVEFINLQDEEQFEKNEDFKELEKDDVDSKYAEYEEDLSKAKSALEFLTQYVPKESGLKALQDNRQSLTMEQLEDKIKNSNWEKVYKKVKEKEEHLSSLESKITKLEGEIDVLRPWVSLDAPFKSLKDLKSTSYFIGTIAKQYEQELLEKLSEQYVEIISSNNDESNILVLVNTDKKDETIEILRGFGFSTFKTDYNDIPSNLISNFQNEIQELNEKIIEVKKELFTFTDEEKILQLMYDYLYNKVTRKTVSKNFLKTKTVVTIQGWNMVDNNNKLKAICKEVLGDDYYLTFEEVKEEDINDVPIKLKNGGMTKAFESVTEMYSYPRYNEVDPTPFLTPFYLIFFGMMVADAGYGLVMLIASLIAVKFLNLEESKKQFAKFFLYLSFPTILFGLIYGSFFGDMLPLPRFIDPNNDVNKILIMSIVLGVIQIFFGLSLKAYTLVKLGKPKDAFYDVGSWIITLVSIGVIALGAQLALPDIAVKIAIGAMIFGMIVIVLTGGRAEETKGAQIGQGLYALYGITGYVGDLVSYTRLMALGLAGGSIAGAFNLLIGQFPGIAAIIFGPVLFLLAHIFNLLLSLLGAYVHTARLQYVEYFSKFYEGGGKPFAPFKASEKYVNLKKN